MKIKITSVITPYENGIAVADGRQMLTETAEGSLTFAENGGRLSYSQNTENGKVETVLTFPPSRESLTLARVGAIGSKIVLEKDKPHESVYEIPPYRFPMTATLLSLDNRLSLSGGRLRLSYQMLIGGEEQSVSLLISVTKEGCDA